MTILYTCTLYILLRQDRNFGENSSGASYHTVAMLSADSVPEGATSMASRR